MKAPAQAFTFPIYNPEFGSWVEQGTAWVQAPIFKKIPSKRGWTVNVSQDMVRTYLLEIAQIPLLTKDQEVIYGRQVQQMMALRGIRETLTKRAGCEPSTAVWAQEANLEEDELTAVLASGQRAKHKMVEANLRLVVSVAKKYQRRGVELLDLIQEGTLGLERGIEKFDPLQGYKLSTYVYWWIRQGITRAIAYQGRTIRIPIHVYDRLSKIRQTQRHLSQQLGRKATPSEIATVLELEISKVRDCLAITRQPISLEVRFGENQETELVEWLKDDGPSPEDYTTSEALRHDIQKLLAELPLRQQEVIMLRFGLAGNEAQSLQEIGERLGLSRERVRQIENQALTRLRRNRNQVREYLVI